jgi:hydrogenase/urease accessory protein HupE
MDKYLVIIALTVLGVGAMWAIPEKSVNILDNIVTALGSIATGYAMGIHAASKNDGGKP